MTLTIVGNAKPTDMLIDELNSVRLDMQRHKTVVDALRPRRNTLILTLVDRGMSEREVAKIAGVSHVVVHDVKKERY